jgi:adenosylmethionine-8-amino-7-oxononanoate aminotransferase
VHERIKQRSLAHGLAIYPTGGTVDGTRGDHVIVAPPYTCERADVDLIVERLDRAVSEVFRDIAGDLSTTARSGPRIDPVTP